MLLVKTTLGLSSIAGIGLFAAQDIPKGTVVWKFEPTFDRLISPEEVANLPPVTQQKFKEYAYLDKVMHVYVFCIDDARFINHAAATATCRDIPEDSTTVAVRDIKMGEEITCDYESFDAEFDSYKSTLI